MANFIDRKNKKMVQQHLYAIPFGTLRIAKPLSRTKELNETNPRNRNKLFLFELLFLNKKAIKIIIDVLKF